MAPHQAARMRNLLHERAMRRVDALQLYKPLPVQEEYHHSAARLNILRGSNRGGKTLPAAAEVAMAVTGQHFVPGKYPKENGRWFCVGKDMAHIGEVMWRKLTFPGAFKIIRDQADGSWRSYRPHDPNDIARKDEARSAPPLIPKRLIKAVSWENKREEIPSKVYLHNGWEMSFFSSLGKPPQGSDIDGWWFDEEIVDPAWFPEMTARILDRAGKGHWSATPQAGTEVLYDLHERATRESYDAAPSVREFVILLADNPHISEADKRALAADLSEEERKVRIDGDFAITSFRVYPEFNMLVHGLDLPDVPGDWTRYMVVDPGHQVCAVLFGAVPPDESQLVLYDELYLRECDAKSFARAVAGRCQGQAIQASIIDPNMALYTEMGVGRTVGQQYSDALANENFASIGTGVGFHLGGDDVAAGILAVHGLLRCGDGPPRLRVVRGRCPHLEDEFRRYVKKRVAGLVTDQPNPRRHSHLMDCVRYLTLHEPRYIKPPPPRLRVGPAVKAFRAKQQRASKAGGETFVHLGPGNGKGGG